MAHHSASPSDSLPVDLHDRDFWIFDMDGTLTVAVHDFNAIREDLGLPPGQPILETLAMLPAEQAERLYRRLHEIEWELAARARAQEGAAELLEGLRQRGGRLGILTRNSKEIAYETLRVCDLLGFFDRECVLARESAAPKPEPDGVRQLLSHWDADPSAAVMVGDYLFDLMAGHRAGAATVYVDIRGSGEWAGHADVTVGDLRELCTLAVIRAEV